MADELQEIYEKYEILSGAKEKILEHSAEYLECINIASKGGAKEKKLIAQIISQFFKHFPDLQDTALNVLLDLCEDGDSDIRISAMKVLPFLCKATKDHILNIASVLAQLLQLEDLDYTVACNSLVQVFREDPVATVNAIFSTLHNTQEEALRDKIVTFLYKRLATIEGKNLPEVEELLANEGKKILQDCTSTEFMLLMPYLTQSKLGKTLHGQKELVSLVVKKIEIDEKFEPLEQGTLNTDRLVLCVQTVLPLFNASNESTKLVVYYCTQVLPEWENIRTLKDGEQIQLRLLRQLATMSTYCGSVENITEVLENIFNRLKEFMPLPPEDVDISNVPNLDFTSVECLLYAFHKLARKSPEFLTSDQDRLKDFRLRLQYFARGVQGCKRGLENTNAKKEELSEENQQKVKIAPAILDNINTIIKDLFYQPPLYKCNIQLSFKSTREIRKDTSVTTKSSGTPKRHVPITFDSANGTGTNTKQIRTNKAGEDRKLYQPPSGKFSSNFGKTNTRGSWGRGGSTRGYRGARGGGRNWRN